MAQERKDIITDDALMAPLIMAENLEVEYEWLMKVSKAGREAGASTDQSQSAKKLRDEITALAGQQQQLLKVQQEVAVVAQKSITVNKAEAQALNTTRVSYSALRTEEERNSKTGKELLKDMQAKGKAFNENANKAGVYVGAMTKLKIELKAARDEMVTIASTLGEDSEEFRNAALRAGELQDKMGDIADASKVLSGDTSFERIGSQTGLLGEKLKNLDFKGATTQIKGLTTTIKGMSLKEATDGLGGFTKGLGGLGKVIIGHPLVLLALIITGIVIAVVALKDKLHPLVKAFDAVGAGLDYVVQKAKDFSDWLGLSAFAAEDNAKRVVAAAESQRKKLEQRYNDEIKLAEAAGESVTNLERSKQRAIQGTAEKAIKALDDQVKAGSKLSKEQQEQYDELKKIAHDADIEIMAINRRQAGDLRKLREEAAKEVEKQIDDRQKLEQQRLHNEIKLQEDIKNTEGKSLEQRIAASVKAEQLRVQLVKKEREAALGDTETGDVFAQAAIQERASAEILNTRKKAAEEQRALLMESINKEAEMLEGIVENEKATWEERVQAASEAMEKRVDALSLSLASQLITQEEYNRAVLELESKTTDKIVELTLERQNRVMDALENQASTGTNDELTALEEQFANEEITYKDYLKRKEEIQDQYQQNSLNLTLDFLKEQRDLLKQAGIDTTAIDKEISEVSLEIAEEANEKRLEGEEEIQEKLKELRTAGVEGILEIIDNFNAAEDERRAAQSEKIAENLENDLELAGTNEEAKAELRNKAEVEQNKLRKEQAAADRKRAVFEKATAALSIGVNTAKGIGMALGTYPPPVSFVLAALVGVLGAIQLGVVLSKPIPSYAKGTKRHGGGWARVSEQGSELVIEPSGREFLTPSKESIIPLAEGAEVVPHQETMRRLAMRAVHNIDRSRGPRESENTTRRLERKFDELNHTIRNKPNARINFSKRGAEMMFERAEARQKMLNDLYR